MWEKANYLNSSWASEARGLMRQIGARRLRARCSTAGFPSWPHVRFLAPEVRLLIARSIRRARRFRALAGSVVPRSVSAIPRHISGSAGQSIALPRFQNPPLITSFSRAIVLMRRLATPSGRLVCQMRGAVGKEFQEFDVLLTNWESDAASGL